MLIYRNIIEHVIRCFTEQKLECHQIAKPPPFAEDECVKLSEDKICRFVAENFLKLNEKVRTSSMTFNCGILCL